MFAVCTVAAALAYAANATNLPVSRCCLSPVDILLR
jgi:hypothetical protein